MCDMRRPFTFWPWMTAERATDLLYSFCFFVVLVFVVEITFLFSVVGYRLAERKLACPESSILVSAAVEDTAMPQNQPAPLRRTVQK